MNGNDKINILVVDDRPEKLIAIESVLASLGQNIVLAKSGTEALKCLLERDFAVILLDVNMPVMNGLETAAMIRSRKSSEHTPIIFFTALSDSDEQVHNVYSLGAVDYMRGPISPPVLRAKVGVFVELYKKREEVKRQAEKLREMEEKQHLQRLAEATDRLEAETKRNRFFTLSIDMLCIADFDCYLRQMNPSWERTLGFSEAELKARPFTDLVHPDDRETTEAQIQKLKGGAEVTYFENRFRTRDESYRWFAWTAAPWLGENLLYIFARDITERKKAEEERLQLIQEQAARATAEAAERRSAFLAMGSAVLTSSLDYRTTLASVARLAIPHLADFCHLDVFGESEDVREIALAHRDPAKEDLLRDLQRRTRRRHEEGERRPGSLETRLHADVTPEILKGMASDEAQLDAFLALNPRSIMMVPLLARGRSLGTMTFATAESNRVYTEADLALAEELGRRAALAVDNARLYREANEANRLKDEFLATVSHELRTPLTAILGWTTLLRMGGLNAENFQRAIDTIERNAKAQSRLVDDLLDVSRIITGKLGLELRPLEIRPVIEAAVTAARPAAEAKDIRIEEQLGLPGTTIAGDPARLQQVIGNLLSNAIKFTPPGGNVRLQVESDEDQVRVRIIDTGKGIRSDFLPYVFERFRQAESGSTRPHGGLGLGLAIVRHLIELHGGHVSAESPGEGLGSTFTVAFPHVKHAGEEVGPGKTPLLDETPHVREAVCLDGLRVLVVDDEEDTREFIRISLQGFGADVLALGSVAEGLEAIRKGRPHVLVSDIGMPGQDGYEFIRKVREMAAEDGARVPAVALTAYAKKEDGARFLSAGFQIHVPKPVDANELAHVVAVLAGRGTRS